MSLRRAWGPGMAHTEPPLLCSAKQHHPESTTSQRLDGGIPLALPSNTIIPWFQRASETKHNWHNSTWTVALSRSKHLAVSLTIGSAIGSATVCRASCRRYMDPTCVHPALPRLFHIPAFAWISWAKSPRICHKMDLTWNNPSHRWPVGYLLGTCWILNMFEHLWHRSSASLQVADSDTSSATSRPLTLQTLLADLFLPHAVTAYRKLTDILSQDWTIG